MNKTQIQEKTKKPLEKADKPKEQKISKLLD